MKSSPNLVVILALALAVHADGSFLQRLGAPASQFPVAAPAGTPDAHDGKVAITPQISHFARTLIAERGVPGLSLGFVRVANGSISTEFGVWGNMTEDGDPVKPETLFSIGSCSKAFLASALGILMDDFANGRNTTALPPALSSVSWDTKLKALLPDDWKLDQEWATEKANLRDILTHVSGLTRHDSSYHRSDTSLGMIRKMRFLKSKYELREKWSYNNLMYVVGAHIVSTYSGVPFRDFVQERIFSPLNMTSTTYRGNEAEASGLLSQSWGSAGRRIPYWFAGDALSEFIAGAGGVISNTIDMTKWLAMLLNKGVDPRTNRTVVPRPTFDEMTTAHSVVYGQPVPPYQSVIGYGMGWMRVSYAGHDMLTHGGGLPGFLTDVAFLTGDHIALVAFANADGVHAAQTLLPMRVIEDYLGLPHSFEFDNSSSSRHAAESSSSSNAGPLSPQTASECPRTHSGGIALEQYAGEYADPGYGAFTLCAPASTAPACAQILADWRAVSPAGELAPDTLYGGSDRVWDLHFKLTRTTRCSSGTKAKEGEKEESFAGESCTIFPDGYGRNTTAFAAALGSLPWTAECVIDRDGDKDEVVGCGLVGLEDGPRWEGESVQERADVWLRKSKSF